MGKCLQVAVGTSLLQRPLQETWVIGAGGREALLAAPEPLTWCLEGSDPGHISNALPSKAWFQDMRYISFFVGFSASHQSSFTIFSTFFDFRPRPGADGDLSQAAELWLRPSAEVGSAGGGDDFQRQYSAGISQFSAKKSFAVEGVLFCHVPA